MSNGVGRMIEGTAGADDLTVLIANLGRLDNLLPGLESLFETVGDELSMRAIVGFNFRRDSDSSRKLRHVFPAIEQLRAPNKLGYCRDANAEIGPIPRIVLPQTAARALDRAKREAAEGIPAVRAHLAAA
jgi:hypothetical protein